MSEKPFSTFLVLPAGGNGERMGLPIPKQYSPVLGKQLFLYTVAAFHRISWLKKIVLCVSEYHMRRVEEELSASGFNNVVVVQGGTTRHRSIHCGIKSLLQFGVKPHDVVVIHDVVRPFVDEKLLEEVVSQAAIHGAAGVTRLLVSTVIQSDGDGFLQASLDRTSYRSSEMPQAFIYETIRASYEQCTEHDLEFGTECLHLVQKYGQVNAKLISGPDYLWKVTHRRDLYTLESCLKENRTVAIANGPDDVTESLVATLRNKNIQVLNLGDVANRPAIFSVDCLVNFRHQSKDDPSSLCAESIGEPPPTVIHVVLLHEDCAYLDVCCDYLQLIHDEKLSLTNMVTILLVRADHRKADLVKMLSDLVWNQSPILHRQLLVI